MAEGLTYGVVPFVSRPALGVVSGMVGAGGNAGSMITLAAFFRGTGRDDVGLINMGITILAVTMLLVFVHFPEHGSMSSSQTPHTRCTPTPCTSPSAHC